LGALTGSSAILVLIAVVTTAILGPQQGARAIFPFFGMVRVVALSEFIERIEVLAIFAWGLGLFIEVAIYLFLRRAGPGPNDGLKNYRPLIMPMTVIWTVFGIHVSENVFQLLEFFKPHFFAPYALALMVLPFYHPLAAYLFHRLLRRQSGAP